MPLITHPQKNVGVLLGNAEKMVGAMAAAWESALSTSNLTQVDVRLGLSDLFSVKDAQEIVREHLLTYPLTSHRHL